MSFEQHDQNLVDMELGGSGQLVPDEEPGLPEGDEAGELVDGELDPETEGELVQGELLEEEVEREEATAEAKARRGPGPLRRLYRGQTSFDFVGRRKWWFLLSIIVIVAGMVSLGVRGLNLGITFKGGTSWTVLAPGVTQTQAENAVLAAGLTQPTVEVLGSGSRQQIEVQGDLNDLTSAQQKTEQAQVTEALAKLAKVSPDTVSQETVGPTWGSQVTQRALIALIVFLVVVAVYISFRFEPKMAIAAFVALVHDLLITVGVYSLAGFQVTPDTVIAVLTILGYSLYDTVVVFDRVRDNTRNIGSTGR
ncbi:MAG TPA: protein translocase subunit SecF, partial [Acidimicrobiales bacterium]|nr:protein translocase subunit SecF [Acidimicrobiales bacterium]